MKYFSCMEYVSCFIGNIESEMFYQLILTFADQTWPAWCLISSLMLFSISEPSYNNITVIVPLKTTEWFMILWKFNPTRYKMQWSAWKRNLKDSYLWIHLTQCSGHHCIWSLQFQTQSRSLDQFDSFNSYFNLFISILLSDFEEIMTKSP